jgi:C4-dicarboxylate-specific signal transduction histidine kinase
MHRALLNLARNAAGADGTTTVRIEALAADDGTVTVDVVDDGPGLGIAAPADGAIPTVTASTGGTGLGLAIADELLRNNSGRLALVETGPAGTRFRAALPRHPPA